MTDQIFTKDGITALEKMVQEGAKKASQSLSTLIKQEVGVEAVTVRSVPVVELGTMIAEPETIVSTVVMEITGDVLGQILLIYPQQSALNVADFLAKRPLGTTTELDELDKSAVKESGNIIAGGFLASLSMYLNINMLESIPDLATDMLKSTIDTAISRFVTGAIADSIAMEIHFVMASANTGEAATVVPEVATTGYFILLFDVSSAEKVMTSLQDISKGKLMMK